MYVQYQTHPYLHPGGIHASRAYLVQARLLHQYRHLILQRGRLPLIFGHYPEFYISFAGIKHKLENRGFIFSNNPNNKVQHRASKLGANSLRDREGFLQQWKQLEQKLRQQNHLPDPSEQPTLDHQ